MAFDFSGKTILVTGATRGIGREIVNYLLKSGAVVYGLGKNPTYLDNLSEQYPGVVPVLVDLEDWATTQTKLETLPAMNGVVNNAAFSAPWISSLEVPKETLDKTFNVNLMGAINVIQVLGKKMVEAGNGGSIVNISSINGINSMRECLAYNVSKAGLDMATKQFALELGPHKIRVNSVNPTVVFTDMSAQHWSEPVRASRIKNHTPLGRFAEISEVVNPVLYLLSDYSSMVTGTINPVDGGLLCNINA